MEQIRKALEKAAVERTQTVVSLTARLPERATGDVAPAAQQVGGGALRAVRGRDDSPDEHAVVSLTQRVLERVADTAAGAPARLTARTRPDIGGHAHVEQPQAAVERLRSVASPPPVPYAAAISVARPEAVVDIVAVTAAPVPATEQDAVVAQAPSPDRAMEPVAGPPVRADVSADIPQVDVAAAAVGGRATDADPAAHAEGSADASGSTEPLPEPPVESGLDAHPEGAAGALADEPESAESPTDRVSIARSAPFSLDPRILERNRVLAPDATGPAASAFRLLRTQVLKRMRERGWRTIGIASARSADGKTTVAANLAITIAADPRHTALLVDFDLRRPGVRTVFGVTPAVGVAEVLAGLAPIEAAFTHPASITRLRLLPARVALPNSSSIVAGAECRAMVSELRDRYLNRIILFDMPPVLEADDAVTLSALFDCLLLVVSEGKTAREDVARALTLVKDTPVIGTVLNRSVEAVYSEAYG